MSGKTYLMNMANRMNDLHIQLYKEPWAKRPGDLEIAKWTEGQRHMAAKSMAKMIGEMTKLKELYDYADAAGIGHLMPPLEVPDEGR